MNTLIQLPFCEDPISTMYNNYSFITGIIQGNNSNSFEPWAFGRYINCIFKSDCGFHFSGSTANAWKEHSDYINIVDRKFGVIPVSKKVAHMKYLLDEGYYIMYSLDEQYIPGMAAYQKWSFIHDSLIIGYNDEKQVFYLYGRFADQKMHLSEVPYSNIEKAVAKKSWYFVLEYNQNNCTNLNISLIRSKLTHYLYSAPEAKRISGRKYGMEAVAQLCNYLLMQYRKIIYMDYRYTRGLMEQKYLMVKMCEYLDANEQSLPDDILQLSKQAADSASIIHLLTLKATIKPYRDEKISSSIRGQFEKLIDNERKYIPELLRCLCSLNSYN